MSAFFKIFHCQFNVIFFSKKRLTIDLGRSKNALIAANLSKEKANKKKITSVFSSICFNLRLLCAKDNLII